MHSRAQDTTFRELNPTCHLLLARTAFQELSENKGWLLLQDMTTQKHLCPCATVCLCFDLAPGCLNSELSYQSTGYTERSRNLSWPMFESRCGSTLRLFQKKGSRKYTENISFPIKVAFTSLIFPKRTTTFPTFIATLRLPLQEKMVGKSVL